MGVADSRCWSPGTKPTRSPRNARKGISRTNLSEKLRRDGCPDGEGQCLQGRSGEQKSQRKCRSPCVSSRQLTQSEHHCRREALDSRSMKAPERRLTIAASLRGARGKRRPCLVQKDTDTSYGFSYGVGTRPRAARGRRGEAQAGQCTTCSTCKRELKDHIQQ